MKYGQECKKFSITNKVLEKGVTLKEGMTREKLMDNLKDSDYSTGAIQKTLNDSLKDSEVNLTEKPIQDIKEMIKKDAIGDNALSIQFTQKDYWGSSFSQNEFHWVGYNSLVGNNVKTNDPYTGKAFDNKGNVDSIKRGIIIEVKKK